MSWPNSSRTCLRRQLSQRRTSKQYCNQWNRPLSSRQLRQRPWTHRWSQRLRCARLWAAPGLGLRQAQMACLWIYCASIVHNLLPYCPACSVSSLPVVSCPEHFTLAPLLYCTRLRILRILLITDLLPCSMLIIVLTLVCWRAV